MLFWVGLLTNSLNIMMKMYRAMEREAPLVTSCGTGGVKGSLNSNLEERGRRKGSGRESVVL